MKEEQRIIVGHLSPDFAQALLAWYDENARALPWRINPTPYRVWVSEIMLQQTQVITVLPYFERFMAALPDVAALAEVEEDALLKLWEGLGYYNRARNLQKAARLVMAEWGGQLPSTYEELLTLPGIGDYTAGAVASIAYAQAVPAVDGNVLRVLARVLDDEGDIADPKTKKQFRSIVQAILPKDRAGDFNQSLMELGARICLPKAVPQCGVCPIAGYCLALAQGSVARLPFKTAKKLRKKEKRTVLLLVAAGKVLLRQRPAQGLLAGLWEYPTVDGWLSADEVRTMLAEQGVLAVKLTALGEARHLFSHLEWQMQGWLVEVRPSVAAETMVWASRVELARDYAIPSAYSAYGKELQKIKL